MSSEPTLSDPELAEAVCRDLLMYRNLADVGAPQLYVAKARARAFDTLRIWEQQYENGRGANVQEIRKARAERDALRAAVDRFFGAWDAQKALGAPPFNPIVEVFRTEVGRG